MAIANKFVFVTLLAYPLHCSCLRISSIEQSITAERVPSAPVFAPWKYCPLPGCKTHFNLMKNNFQIDLHIKKDEPSKYIQNVGMTPLRQKPWGSSNHCRLRNAMDTHGSRFVVTGGSATAGAGLVGEEENWFKKLEHHLGNGKRIFHNAAQGATESFWAANVLDFIVGDADVLLWEYAINDFKGGSSGHPTESPESMRQGMEFFVKKALQLPSRPALIFVYLYDAETAHTDFYSTALQHQESVLKRFADAGIDMLVVPVQQALIEVHAESDMREHHPGAMGHEAIAQLLEEQMRLAANSTTGSGCDVEHYGSTVKQVLETDGGSSDVTDHSILRRLYSLSSKSASAVQPFFGQSEIKATYCRSDICGDVVKAKYGKAENGRQDRKIGYDVPTCDGDQSLRIELQNITSTTPSIVGMHLGGGQHAVNGWSHKVQISSNGQTPKIFEKPASYIGDVSSLFPEAFNMWMEIDTSTLRDEGLDLRLCMPQKGLTGNWGSLQWSPFEDGGGRVDWITVFS